MKVNKEKLYQFFKTYENQEKFDNYMKNFKSFSKNKQGKSGAEIGSIDKKTVMKISKIKFKQNSIIDNDCLFLKSQINEIFINYILTNLEKFTTLNNKELRIKNKYLLKSKDFGLTKERAYILNDKIGVVIDKKYMTNLNEILVLNHFPKIQKNPYLIKRYQKYFIGKIIRPLDFLLSILNKKVKFYHTDLKLENIFIRESTIKSYEDLKEKGVFINFTPLLSDLDKSRLTFNNKSILPIDDKKIITKIGKALGYEPLLSLRFDCKVKYGKEKCIKFKQGDFDILTIFINVYLLLHKFKLKDLFEELDNYVKNRFQFCEEDLLKFKNVIKKEFNSFSIIDKTKPTKMSGIIYQLCKKLEY